MSTRTYSISSRQGEPRGRVAAWVRSQRFLPRPPPPSFRSLPVFSSFRRRFAAPRPIVLPTRSVRSLGPVKRPHNSQDVFSDVLDTFRRAFSNPALVAVGFLVLVFLYTHNFDLSKGPVKDFSDHLASKINDNKTKAYVTQFVPKLVGFALYAPTLFTAPPHTRGKLFFLSVAILLMLPAGTAITYAGQSILMYVYLRSKTNSTKMLIVCLAAILSVTGMLFTIPTS